jgi:hypothetical protein
MSRMSWIALVSVALCPLAAPAQEYAIKLAKPGPGDQFQVKVDNATETDFKLLDAGGQAVMEKKETKGHTLIFRETGVERGPAGGDLVKLKRSYKKAQRTIDGDRRTLPFQGETVLIEKKGDAFIFQIEGGETLQGDDTKELHEEFNKGAVGKLFELFLPKKTVKVNESWKFDVGLLVKEFTKDGKIEIDPAKSSGSGKLLKAYPKNGKQFGILELTVTMAVTHLINDGNKTPTKQGKIVIKLETDGCIDGSLDQSQMKATFDGDIRGEINANGMDFGLEVTIRGKVDEQRTPVSK